MTEYDDYFTNEDKPYAENINDALLLSNVWDYTVPITIPDMFQDQEWITSVGLKKCGVAVVGLKEALSGITSTTVDEHDALTGTGTMKLSFYPNFNSFGGITAVEWDATGSIRVDIYDAQGVNILEDIDNGVISDVPAALRVLQKFELRITFTNATLTDLKVTMKNKDKERYGADVSKNYVVNKLISVFEDLISTGSGVLYDRINTLINQSFYLKTEITSLLNGKVDKETGKTLSSNDYTTTEKNKLSGIAANANNYSHPSGQQCSHSHSYSSITGKPSTFTPSSHTHSKNDITNFKSEIVNIIYPVGSIYISVSSTSPATLFGGTWTQIKDKFLLSCGNSYINGETGGEANHKLTIAEMPTHKHDTAEHYHEPLEHHFLEANKLPATGSQKRVAPTNSGGTYYVQTTEVVSFRRSNTTSLEVVSLYNNGGNGSHNNMPPYLAVYVWKRTG